MFAEKTLKSEMNSLQHIKPKARELSEHCRTLSSTLDDEGRFDNEDSHGESSGHYLFHYDMAQITTFRRRMMTSTSTVGGMAWSAGVSEVRSQFREDGLCIELQGWMWAEKVLNGLTNVMWKRGAP